ncbi:MAG: hypothetical protein ACOCWI_02330 [Bacillota bacterium]
MNNSFYENVKYIETGEWYLLLLSFSLILFKRQAFEVFDNFAYLINHLLVSLSALINFVVEALFVLGGQVGMRGGYYAHILLINHLLPWFLFILLVDIVQYLFERIVSIIKNAYLWGKRAVSGARLAMKPNECKNFVLSSRTLVLLQ